MGSSIVRAFRNFNVESRAHRLIGKDKPRPAPMHPGTKEAAQAAIANHADVQDKIYNKDNPLLSRLKEVFVDSTDPLQQKTSEIVLPKQEDLRLPKNKMRNDIFGIAVNTIPKGMISIVETLTILSNHKTSPETWTAEKIAGEYNLDIKDTQAVLQFFTPFDIKVVSSDDKEKIDEK